MSEIDRRISILPKWAQAHIRNLEGASQPDREEIRDLRRKLQGALDNRQRLRDSLDAILEIIRCAAAGGSQYAKTMIDVLDAYDLHRTGEESEAMNDETVTLQRADSLSGMGTDEPSH